MPRENEDNAKLKKFQKLSKLTKEVLHGSRVAWPEQ